MIALVFIILISCVIYLGSRFATFRLFFAWPQGGTWSNTIAWLEDAALGGFFIWYFRDKVGQRLARWWHQHRAEHMNDHMSAVRAHVTSELTSFETRVHALLADHHDKIIMAVNGNGNGNSDNKQPVRVAPGDDGAGTDGSAS